MPLLYPVLTPPSCFERPLVLPLLKKYIAGINSKHRLWAKNEECAVEMNATTVICLKTVPRYFISPGNALKPVGSLLKPDDKNIYSSTAIKKESESIKTVNNTLYMT